MSHRKFKLYLKRYTKTIDAYNYAFRKNKGKQQRNMMTVSKSRGKFHISRNISLIKRSAQGMFRVRKLYFLRLFVYVHLQYFSLLSAYMDFCPT